MKYSRDQTRPMQPSRCGRHEGAGQWHIDHHIRSVSSASQRWVAPAPNLSGPGPRGRKHLTRTPGGHTRWRILNLPNPIARRKDMGVTRIRNHRLVIGGVSLAGAGFAAGLCLVVPAWASSSTRPSSGSVAAVTTSTATSSARSGAGSAATVGGAATPTPSQSSPPDWVPAASGQPPDPCAGILPAPNPNGPPDWVPAGSGAPPAPGSCPASQS
jgi:hypothetical protein